MMQSVKGVEMNIEPNKNDISPLPQKAALESTADQASRIDLHLVGQTTDIRGEISSATTKESRLHQLYKDNDVNTLNSIPRAELLEYLNKATTCETVIIVLSLMKVAQTPEEVQACLKLIEVDRTPSWFSKIKAYVGIESKQDVFPGRVGPRIWFHCEREVDGILPQALGLESGPVNVFRYDFDEQPYNKLARRILRMTSESLRGVSEAQLPLSRLAVNLYSEEHGLGANSTILSQMLANTFPDQLDCTVVLHRGRSSYRIASFADHLKNKLGLKVVEGQTIPTPPAGLDGRERGIFSTMVKKLVIDKTS
jgi:hypothetical protein